MGNAACAFKYAATQTHHTTHTRVLSGVKKVTDLYYNQQDHKMMILITYKEIVLGDFGKYTFRLCYQRLDEKTDTMILACLNVKYEATASSRLTYFKGSICNFLRALTSL